MRYAHCTSRRYASVEYTFDWQTPLQAGQHIPHIQSSFDSTFFNAQSNLDKSRCNSHEKEIVFSFPRIRGDSQCTRSSQLITLQFACIALTAIASLVISPNVLFDILQFINIIHCGYLPRRSGHNKIGKSFESPLCALCT